jgi:hypothetical protein
MLMFSKSGWGGYGESVWNFQPQVEEKLVVVRFEILSFFPKKTASLASCHFTGSRRAILPSSENGR